MKKKATISGIIMDFDLLFPSHCLFVSNRKKENSYIMQLTSFKNFESTSIIEIFANWVQGHELTFDTKKVRNLTSCEKDISQVNQWKIVYVIANAFRIERIK